MRALIAAAFLSFAIVAPCAALHERPAALQTEFPSRLETRADIAADEWLVLKSFTLAASSMNLVTT